MGVLWIGLAYILGLTVSYFKVPPLVGYLGAGFLLASFGFEGGEIIAGIAHLGVLFLLFTVGLELRFKNIWRPEVLGTGGVHFIISGTIFFAAALGFGYSVISAVFIAAVLALSSTVIAAKTLESRGELGAYYGRVAIGILILQDIIAILLIALSGGKLPSIWSLCLLVLPLLRPFLIKALIVSSEELKLLFGLLLAIGGGVLFESFGLSSELGALATGALLSGHEETEDLSEKLWGLKEAFLVGFFLNVGLAGLPSVNDLGFIVIILLLLPLKSILFFLLQTGFKLRARTAFMSSITLSSYSEFTLIAGAVAASAGFIPNEVVVVFAVVTALSYAVNAAAASNTDFLWQKWESSLLKFERDVKHPDQQVLSLGNAEYLVVGMGEAGKAAYDEIRNKKLPVAGLDIDPARIEDSREDTRRILYGDAKDRELWENMDMSSLKAVMLAIPNVDPKLAATEAMRKNGYQGEINALTIKDEEFRLLREAGANAVCLPITQAGRKLAELSTDEELDSTETSMSIKLNRGQSK